MVIGDIFAEMAELADARDLKSLGPKARPGSIPGLGTNFTEKFSKAAHRCAKKTRGGAAW
jgi:hypothetical protein